MSEYHLQFFAPAPRPQAPTLPLCHSGQARRRLPHPTLTNLVRSLQRRRHLVHFIQSSSIVGQRNVIVSFRPKSCSNSHNNDPIYMALCAGSSLAAAAYQQFVLRTEVMKMLPLYSI